MAASVVIDHRILRERHFYDFVDLRCQKFNCTTVRVLLMYFSVRSGC